MSEFKKNTDLMSGGGEWDEAEHPRNEDGEFTSKGLSTGKNIKYPTEPKEKEAPKNILDAETVRLNGDGGGKINIKKLSSDIESVLDGSYQDHHVTLLEETPKMFQAVGVPNKPILMTKKHVYLAINDNGKYTSKNDHYHNLGKQKFLDATMLLQSPILAFQSNTDKSDIVSIVNVVDKSGDHIIVPIKINGKGKYNYIEIDANIAKSMYGKNNIQKFIDKYVTEDNLLFFENKKIRNLQE